jgi:hypothetical protein
LSVASDEAQAILLSVEVAMKEEPYYLRERMRAASENLATLIWVALGVGFLLGLTTNIATEYVLEWPHRWLALSVSATLTIGVMALVIRWVYSKGYDITSEIEVVLPFRVTSTTAETLIAEPYSVTHTAHQLFEWMMEKNENKSRFLRDWRQAVQDGKQPFQGFARQCVRDILEYVVLDAFREYVDRTLTPKAIFTRHGWSPMKLPMRKLPLAEWPEQLKDNVCFQHSGKPVFQQIEIPEDVALGVREHKGADGTEKRETTLSSPYGVLSFAISPYPQRISSRSREGTVVHKYCGVSEQSDLWIAKFSLRIRAEFGGLRVFSKHFQENFLPWVEGLLECVKNELDWQLCLERDLERIVVELREEVKTLLQHQPGSVREQAKGG